MTAPAWLLILISSITDFVIVSGSTVLGAMLATGNTGIPPKSVWILAGLSGLIAAAKEVRSLLHLSPVEAGAIPKA